MMKSQGGGLAHIMLPSPMGRRFQSGKVCRTALQY